MTSPTADAAATCAQAVKRAWVACVRATVDAHRVRVHAQACWMIPATVVPVDVAVAQDRHVYLACAHLFALQAFRSVTEPVSTQPSTTTTVVRAEPFVSVVRTATQDGVRVTWVSRCAVVRVSTHKPTTTTVVDVAIRAPADLPASQEHARAPRASPVVARRVRTSR
jgi:hypothetical protein